MSRPDVLVLGGGIIGLACARELAKAGRKVEVLERLAAGAEASTAAAGMLTPTAEAPVAGPFFDACRESRDLWASFRAELEEETGLTIDYDDSGALLVALEEEEAAQLDAVAESTRALGEPVEECDLEMVKRWVPDIAPRLRRALLLRGEHRVDNVQACAVLAVAAAKLGVEHGHGREVERVEFPAAGGVRVIGKDWQREADLLLLAAGAWSGGIEGLRALPVRPVRGQMLLLGGVNWPWKGIVRDHHAYAVRRGETGLLVGSTVEEAGFQQQTTVDGIGGLLDAARRLFPRLGEARLETTWAGLRPGTPDDLPIIGRLPGIPVVAATGHFRNGILLAPWTAREVARLVVDGSAERPAFLPGRFG